MLWVNVDGLADSAVIHEIGKMFGLHPLALEDVVHLHQRAKVEEYGETTFITARMVQLNNNLQNRANLLLSRIKLHTHVPGTAG